MKYLVYLLLLGVFTLAAIWLVPYLPGYVLIRVGGWAVETSVIALAVLLIITYLLISGSVWLWNLPAATMKKAVEKRSRAQLELGMLALAEGNWSKAERALRKSAQNSSTPSVSYIAAAQAAHGPGAEERRAQYLAQAEQAGDSQASVLITRARLLLADNDPAGALAVLEKLSDRRNRPRALDLLARAYERLERWEELAAIAPDLVRHGIVEADQADRLTARAIRHRLAAAENLDTLRARWQALSRAQRREPAFLAARAARAEALGGGAALEPELRKVLGKNWSPEVLEAYARIEGGELPTRIKAAETWLAQHPGDPVLLLLLGRLCRAAGTEGKALDYLNRATAGRTASEAWAELASIREERGEKDEALKAYRAALARPVSSDATEAAQGGTHQISQSESEKSTAAASSSADSKAS